VLSELHNKIQIKHYLHYNRSIEPNELDLPINTFYKRLYGNRYNIYDIIPENKKREEIEHLDTLSHAIPDVSDSMIQSYNDNVVGIFRKIEQNGLWTEKGFEYTKYNLFTTTGRPANSNNGINYAALNKDDGCRKSFTSRFTNGMLIEMDFDAYHVRLIADIIGYKLPEGSVHTYFGKQYFGTDELSDDQYEQSKQITFRLLYGGIDKDFEKIPFFGETKKYIYSLWRTFKKDGYITTPYFKRPMYKNYLQDTNPNKLFNYLLQASETENNLYMINEVNSLLGQYNSELILYTYDSLLFDYDIKDGKELLLKLKHVMSQTDKYPVKINAGINYHAMQNMTSKVI